MSKRTPRVMIPAWAWCIDNDLAPRVLLVSGGVEAVVVLPRRRECASPSR